MSRMTQLLLESEWTGLVAGHRRAPDVVQMRLPYGPSEEGLACAFPIEGKDGRLYWLKPPHQGEDQDFALATEYIVGRLGALIEAPTCPNVVIEIEPAMAGYEYSRGKILAAGLGHATVEVPAAMLERPNLKFRNQDDNRVRHARIFALWDWCWGSDQQWLHGATEDNATYSHDHGFFFPPAGWRWTIEELRRHVDEPHQLRQSADGLCRGDLVATAEGLERVDRVALAEVLRRVPQDWPVEDRELEVLGWFLERRAPAAAERIRTLI